jgi:hypothetical protein
MIAHLASLLTDHQIQHGVTAPRLVKGEQISNYTYFHNSYQTSLARNVAHSLTDDNLSKQDDPYPHLKDTKNATR